ncbi:MAG: polysaccharide deacetylase family protein [Paucibacter sp.]|nr:polysaccharide deacetylase family protein [Roseateles sp.]
MLLKAAFAALSPAGQGARLSVLIFHRVLPQADDIFPEEVDARRFDEICQWLRQWMNVLPLDEACARLKDGMLPSRAACITFDDGYADNCSVAMPILQRHGLTATFFIASGFLNGGRMWNDTVYEAFRHAPAGTLELGALGHFQVDSPASRRAAIDAVIDRTKYLEMDERIRATEALARHCGVTPANDLMMTSEQVRELVRGSMQVGAHTRMHPILARLSRADAMHEMAAGRAELETIIGRRVGLFAYPNGKPGEDYLPRDVELVRELGFDAAVSTAWGAARVGSDPYQLPRFTPWDRTRARFGLRLLRNLR